MYERESTTEKKSKGKWSVRSYVFMTAMFMMFVILVMIGVFGAEFIRFKLFSNHYVTGYSAKYCYFIGDADPQIKHKLYFHTLSECGKPLYDGNE